MVYLQSKDFLPDRCQGLVFRVGLYSECSKNTIKAEMAHDPKLFIDSFIASFYR